MSEEVKYNDAKNSDLSQEDKEIIANLEMIQNMELLQNMDQLQNLDESEETK